MKPTPDTARHTLAGIDAALRIADRSAQLWRDAAFQAWEHGQVDEDLEAITTSGITRYIACPGPEHPESSPTYIGEGSVHIQPMVSVATPGCHCGADDEGHSDSHPMRVLADDYPHLAETTYGPLMLGPEPAELPQPEPTF